MVLNAAARLVVGLDKYEHITPVLRDVLHRCSFHEPEQLGSWKAEHLHRNSSCLELTAASPSLPVHQSRSVSSTAQDSSFQVGISLAFPLRTIEEIKLNCNWSKCYVMWEHGITSLLQNFHLSRSYKTNKKAVLSQRQPRNARYITRSWAVAEIWPFEIIQDGGGRHL